MASLDIPTPAGPCRPKQRARDGLATAQATGWRRVRNGSGNWVSRGGLGKAVKGDISDAQHRRECSAPARHARPVRALRELGCYGRVSRPGAGRAPVPGPTDDHQGPPRVGGARVGPTLPLLGRYGSYAVMGGSHGLGAGRCGCQGITWMHCICGGLAAGPATGSRQRRRRASDGRATGRWRAGSGPAAGGQQGRWATSPANDWLWAGDGPGRARGAGRRAMHPLPTAPWLAPVDRLRPGGCRLGEAMAPANAHNSPNTTELL